MERLAAERGLWGRESSHDWLPSSMSGSALLFCGDGNEISSVRVFTADGAGAGPASSTNEARPADVCLMRGVERVWLAPGTRMLLLEGEAGDGRVWERRCPACAVECDFALWGDAAWAREGVGSYQLEAGPPCLETDGAGVVDGAEDGGESGGRRVIASVAVDLDLDPGARELVAYEGDSAERAVERFLDKVKAANRAKIPIGRFDNLSKGLVIDLK